MAICKAVFLDVGGTLLDMGDPEGAYRDVLQRHGYDLPPDELHRCLLDAQQTARQRRAARTNDFTVDAEKARAWRIEMASDFLRRADVKRDFEECLSDIQASWIGTSVFHLFPETRSVLAQLKEAGMTLVAVSNWESRLVQLCASHSIAQYLDHILASEAEGYIKPGTRLFELALERADVGPNDVVHVGDSMLEDIQSAESVGIKSVLVRRRGAKQRQSAVVGPDSIDAAPSGHSPCIPSLEPLPRLVTAKAWLRGKVTTGKGEARGFTQIPWVRQQLIGKLGFEPYPGTLNVRIEETDGIVAWMALRARPGIDIEPEDGFCAARCYPVDVEGQIRAAIILPLVAGYSADVVEVVGPVSLRDALGLSDGSAVTLAVCLASQASSALR